MKNITKLDIFGSHFLIFAAGWELASLFNDTSGTKEIILFIAFLVGSIFLIRKIVKNLK